MLDLQEKCSGSLCAASGIRRTQPDSYRSASEPERLQSILRVFFCGVWLGAVYIPRSGCELRFSIAKVTKGSAVRNSSNSFVAYLRAPALFSLVSGAMLLCQEATLIKGGISRGLQPARGKIRGVPFLFRPTESTETPSGSIWLVFVSFRTLRPVGRP